MINRDDDNDDVDDRVHTDTCRRSHLYK